MVALRKRGVAPTGLRRVRRDHLLFLAFIAPNFLLLGVFSYWPLLYQAYLSLTRWDMISPTKTFVGLSNYRFMFSEPGFHRVLLNTGYFTGAVLVGSLLLGLALAMLLDHAENRRYRLTPLVYAAILLAWVNPSVIAGFQWVAMFDFYYGSLNEVLNRFGFASVNWLGDYPMLSVIIVNVWRGTAFAMLIFLGALRTIPSQVYEAARIDGAGAARRFWDHTLPNLRHIAVLVLLSVTMSTFGTFILIQTLTNGGPGIQTETIALYAYHQAFRDYDIAYGSTIAVVMLAINFAFAGFYLRVSRPKV